MPDDSLYLKIITELENKKAFESVDDIAVYLQKTIGTAIDKTNLKFGKLGEDGKTSIYHKLLKQGNSFLKIPLEIDNESGKVIRQAKNSKISFATKNDLQYFSGVSPEFLIPATANNKETKKSLSSFGKVLNRFKSYGLLRVVRTIFMAIEKGLSQGIEKLTAFDKQANKTMASIQSSSEKVFGGIALAVMPIIEAVAPILDSIANVVADIGNSISRASAEAKGMSTYTKVNLDYLKQSANEANKMLATFDKFETLNGQESPFISGSVEADKGGLLSDTKFALTEISAILATIGGYKIISWLTSGKAEKFLEKTKTDLPDIKTKILNISSALGFIYAVYEMIAEVQDLIYNRDAKPLAEKIKSICKIALLGIGAVLIAFGALLTALANPAGAVLKVAGLSAIASTAILDAVGVFANGGIAEKGSLFVANEKGPELVYSGHNNSSSIMNIAQFKQAMVEALYEASDVFQNGNGGVVLNLDGAEIARSKRFKSELNRTNSGLNLR